MKHYIVNQPHFNKTKQSKKSLQPRILYLANLSFRNEGEIKTLPHRKLPGGSVVKNPPANAGDIGSILCPESKIPHATGKLSPRATTTDAHVSHSPCSATRETTAMRRPSTTTRVQHPTGHN